MVTVQLHQGGRHLLVRGSDRRTLAGLAGAHWSGRDFAWSFPATIAAAGNLSSVLPGAEWAPEAEPLLRSALAAVEARELRDADDLPDLPDPTGQAPPAYPHQRQAFHFAQAQDAAGLWIDMGGGKSRVAVALALAWGARRILVTCPRSVLDDDNVWGKEFAKWAGDRFVVGGRVFNRRTGRPKARASVADRLRQLEHDADRAQVLGRPLVAVVPWDSFWRPPLADWLLSEPWDLWILDEVHRIKAPGGKASKFAARVQPRARRRVGLSGTPLPHSRLDGYAVYRALDPGIYGTHYGRFKARYAVTVPLPNAPRAEKVVGWQHEDEFDRKFHSIAYTWDRDREILGLEEPVVVERHVRLSRETWRVYRDLEEELISDIAGGVVVAQNALVRLLRLQQVLSGVVTLADGAKTRVGSEKLDSLAELLEDLKEDEPLVAFGRFRGDLDGVHEASRRRGRRSAELSGRIKALDVWKGGAAEDLAVQIQAGGVGIDLTRASYAAYLSVGFSLVDFDQSMSRLDRPGQRRFVTFVRFIAEGPNGERTVDHDVYEALDSRRDAVEAVYHARKRG